MASIVPARIIGVEKQKGSLVPGKDADIVMFAPEIASEISDGFVNKVNIRNSFTKIK